MLSETEKKLWLVAWQARLILARYPFDDKSTMRGLYRELAARLAQLPEDDYDA